MRKKNRFQNINTPMQMTEALREIGEEYTKKEQLLGFSCVIAISLALGLLLELQPLYMLITVAAYALAVPRILYNIKKQRFEVRRFHDVNAYMRQMAQSFVTTQNFIDCLRQTSETFPTGRMYDTLSEAVKIIDEGNTNITKAKEDAVALIESEYGCEKIRDLHRFLLLAETRGGKCETEFTILEKTRNAWKNAMNGYYGKLKTNKLIGIVSYILLLIFCVIFLNTLRSFDLDIFKMPLTQIANVIMLFAFILLYIRLDNKLNVSLLKDATFMTKEKADEYFAFINNFDGKRERKKYLALRIISIVAALVLILLTKSTIGIVLGGVIVLFGFNIHNIMLLLVKAELQSELRRAFPIWLFDVILLVQRESIEGAIKQSLEDAPPIMISELQRIVRKLELQPHDKDAYMSFFADFHFMEIEEAMRTLYSLAIGSSGTNEILSVVIESNIKFLNDAERRGIEVKTSLMGPASIPIVVVSFGMIMYLVSTVIVVMGDITAIF